ncbi:programmed cell death 6 [Brachionus plicatilis]|uniref:Programmed cell death 6 n=1 Tax=Brachionus plicatilis TaxID=10195 RepID=A0A3M7RUS2_BRAPC|nr:programmed cell death 6 [Brachionus plicatilis]
MYGSQPPYPNAPRPNFNQPGQNLYPNIANFPPQNNQPYPGQQATNALFSGVTNPSTRPYAPASNPGYPVQPGYGSNAPYSSQPFQNQGYPSQPTMPTQPGFGPGPNYNQNPGFGYPPQNAGYQAYPSQGSGYGMNNSWNEQNYLKQIFDEIDHNRNGQISVQELHEALKRGQPMFDFDPFTVQYDNNRNNEISFQEFYDLFVGLNIQFNEFLDIDRDSSGFIDSRELASSMYSKGYQFSPETFDYVVNEISRRSGKQGISFDIYVRVAARFEALRNEYNRMPVKNMPMEIIFAAFKSKSKLNK